MIVFKRRLLFWLIRAYLKKWGRVIFFSFIAGLIIFVILFYTSSIIIKLIPIQKNTTTGVAGLYTTDSLPSFILNQVAQGLTVVDDHGDVKPGLAKSWEIKNKGREYIFHLDTSKHFTDGKPFTSQDVNYNFADVKVSRPNPATIVFDLHQDYSPFLVTVSRPILKNSSIGTGDYKITNLQTNGSFLQTLTLVSKTDRFKTEKYVFYSTQDVLKKAFLLGEINSITMLPDIDDSTANFKTFPNVMITKYTEYSHLVTLFYNTQDSVLSDNQVRSALSYAVRNTFSEGERAYLPYPPNVWYFDSTIIPKTQDFTHAKLLIAASNQKIPTLDLKTQSEYDGTARELAADFKKIGINTKIEDVDSIPGQFQMYLGVITLPKDPDQYALWHEKEPNNLSLLIDKRIDKYLEDGRQTLDQNQRKSIYDDFQKYLIDRAPATFLYFPYEYTVTRD